MHIPFPSPPLPIATPLDKSTIRIHSAHQLNTLFIHRKHNPATQDQPPQSRQGPTPKCKQPLILRNQTRAVETILIQRSRLDTLHARLDRIERLRHVNRDDTCQPPDSKGRQNAQFFPGRGIRLRELTQRSVGTETDSRIGRLTGGGGDETLEESAQASLAGDYGNGVEKASKTRFGGFAVVDSGRGLDFHLERIENW